MTPSDGKSEGSPYLTPPVKILDSAPVIQEVWVEPKLPFANDNLKAQVKSSDLDGDFVYYTFQWEKDGKVIPDEKNQVLERGRFKKGDSIAVTVVPDDREIQGGPKKSDPVLISNSPPMITSSPPTSVKGTTYRVSVKANDPDQDPIVFTLKSGPKGMAIDKDKGSHPSGRSGKKTKEPIPLRLKRLIRKAQRAPSDLRSQSISSNTPCPEGTPTCAKAPAVREARFGGVGSRAVES